MIHAARRLPFTGLSNRRPAGQNPLQRFGIGEAEEFSQNGEEEFHGDTDRGYRLRPVPGIPESLIRS